MRKYNVLEAWLDITKIEKMNSFAPLSDDDIEFWSSYVQWPATQAIFLSLGCQPQSSSASNFDDISDQVMQRIRLIESALAEKKLSCIKVPRGKDATSYLEDSVVDVKEFILWARTSFTTTCDALFTKADDNYKSASHAKSGANKGKTKDDILDVVTQTALQELENDCKCQHSELAEYLYHMKRGNGLPAFPIPKSKKTKKENIKKELWIGHILNATKKAFRDKTIPTRNEPKPDEPRGRQLCPLHKDWTIPTSQ